MTVNEAIRQLERIRDGVGGDVPLGMVDGAGVVGFDAKQGVVYVRDLPRDDDGPQDGGDVPPVGVPPHTADVLRANRRIALRRALGPKLDRLMALAAEAKQGRHPKEAEQALYERIYGDSEDNEFANEAVRLLARLAVNA
jgi:hypothetical protein